jgi:hypothetical protein
MKDHRVEDRADNNRRDNIGNKKKRLEKGSAFFLKQQNYRHKQGHYKGSSQKEDHPFKSIRHGNEKIPFPEKGRKVSYPYYNRLSQTVPFGKGEQDRTNSGYKHHCYIQS